MTNQLHDEAYDVSAEFYDLLQGERDRARARARFAPTARRARQAVLDIGAGTGIVTDVLVRAATVPIHAVEPSRAMRAGLLARVARLSPEDRSRVAVHPCTVQASGLRQVADLAVAANMVPCLPPAERRAMWRSLATALTPGALLLFDPPPQHPTRDQVHWRLSPTRLGPDRYHAEVTSTPRGDTQVLTFTYRIHRKGRLIREEDEQFTLWPTPSAVLDRELREAGFTPTHPPHPALFAATLRPDE
ncbi:class I SAM-dependent methyltransferase [Actinokineospora sp. NPDC004072]